jgi:hypothetical protein
MMEMRMADNEEEDRPAAIAASIIIDWLLV